MRLDKLDTGDLFRVGSLPHVFQAEDDIRTLGQFVQRKALLLSVIGDGKLSFFDRVHSTVWLMADQEVIKHERD